MPPIDGEVSESEVLSMFDKDGDLRDEPQDVEESVEEGQDEEPQEEEETDEEAEEEEGEEEEESEEEESEEDEESEEEADPELDWSKVTPEHKAAFDASQKEVAKLRKDYGKIQSKLHELSQSRREEDQTTQQIRQQAEVATQWNEILEQHPELLPQIKDLIQKVQNPEAAIPEHLREDPAVQFMLERERRLERELKQLRDQTKPLDEWKAEKQTAMNRQKLEGLLDEAGKEYKAMFGKDMDDKAKHAVLKFMVDKKYYESGSNAAISVFGAQYKQALSAKETSRLREKAAKFGGRTKSVNSRRAASAPKINTERDAISQALRDQGLEV